LRFALPGFAIGAAAPQPRHFVYVHFPHCSTHRKTKSYITHVHGMFRHLLSLYHDLVFKAVLLPRGPTKPQPNPCSRPYQRMNLVYFSHSYREEDAQIVRYFGRLLRSENLIPSLDPPSKTVNAAKLERHLNSSDGMVAVLTRREGGVSLHILFEIALCLKARKPLVIFVEDLLSDKLVPARVLQRRFSRKSFLRQVRQHRHGLQIFKAYLGESPPPRYQPSISRRSCLVIGMEVLKKTLRNAICAIVEARGYNPIDITHLRRKSPDDLEIYECIACSDLALSCIDSVRPESQYLMGAAQAAFIPAITFTTSSQFKFNRNIPTEYQPRIMDTANPSLIQVILEKEFDVYEQDFVELENQSEVETYTALLVDVASSKGKYEEGVRNIFIEELIMRDQYKTGQAGAVGPGARAEHMNFNQIWIETGSAIPLDKLGEELTKLREVLLQSASDPEHYAAIGAVSSAEIEAKNGAGPKALEYLSKAGKWTLDIASKIGTTVAAAAIKESLGIK
jgi:hypothetical protein